MRATDGVGGDALSFDPRSWPGVAEAMAASARAEPASARRGDSRRIAIATAASLAVLLAGGIAARLSRHAGAVTVISGSPAEQPLHRLSHRTLVLAGPADLKSALLANGIPLRQADAAAAAAIAALGAKGEVRAVLTIADAATRPTLTRLEASNPDSSGAIVSPGAGGQFTASHVAADLTSKTIVRRGKMDADSFYSSAVAAGVIDSVIPDFAKALAFDFDFQREVGLGDAFEAAFEQEINASGEPVGAPTLVYASLTTATKSSSVYRFKPPGDAMAQWFDSSGRSVVRSLMRTPVDGARVSSTFGMRVHPILGFMKLHKGIDFAAPIGTPIYASGKGIVELASPSATAGNWAKIRHDNGWETVYMHMNRYMPGIVAGAHVSQGQEIGEVGTTGRSTGPHLHYEVHINNEPVDPLGIQTDSGETLRSAALVAFSRERDRIDVARARQAD